MKCFNGILIELWLCGAGAKNQNQWERTAQSYLFIQFGRAFCGWYGILTSNCCNKWQESGSVRDTQCQKSMCGKMW